jgi:DNA-directed RNA polymerase specialized sigma24 family protein
MDHLPLAQGRVFMMRERLELGTDEICTELQITATSLWVLLHRGRLRLRLHACSSAGSTKPLPKPPEHARP